MRTKLLDKAVPSSAAFRAVVEVEFHALTSVGNDFAIRHHELHAEELPSDDAMDHAFVRLASLIAFVLRQTGRMAE